MSALAADARRVVLDNCVPRRLAEYLEGVDVRTVQDFGWGDEDDGPLLRLLEPVCDLFVTVDRNLPFQQRLDQRPFATVVLIAVSNRIADLRPLAPALMEAVVQAASGSVTRVAG